MRPHALPAWPALALAAWCLSTPATVEAQDPAPSPDGRSAEAAPTSRYPELPLRRGQDDGLSGVNPGGFGLLGALLLAATAGVATWKLRSAPRPAGPMGPAAAGGGWLARLGRLAPRPSNHSLEVVQSTRLTGRVSVHVVRWQGREWLVGCSDQAVTVIGQSERATGWSYSPQHATTTAGDPGSVVAA